jgi:hypothetical protein
VEGTQETVPGTIKKPDCSSKAVAGCTIDDGIRKKSIKPLFLAMIYSELQKQRSSWITEEQLDNTVLMGCMVFIDRMLEVAIGRLGGLL